jgi:hypothetical protein
VNINPKEQEIKGFMEAVVRAHLHICKMTSDIRQLLAVTVESFEEK